MRTVALRNGRRIGKPVALVGGSVLGVDPDRARALLERERERIEQLIADLSAGDDEDEPGERGSETLYQKEFDEGRSEDLRQQLAAVERAEARLAAGTYGLSVETGDPIPDERLEAMPTAERNVGE
jgi:DnaK suppressor protein